MSLQMHLGNDPTTLPSPQESEMVSPRPCLPKAVVHLYCADCKAEVVLAVKLCF